MAQDLSAGERFARSFLAKDWSTLEEVLHPQVDFRGLTPGRPWEASTARELIDDVLRQWLEPGDEVYETLGITTDHVLRRGRVAYRFRLRSGGDDYVCEQTAYFDQQGDRIKKLRILCSGFLPASDAEIA
jgi:hypothetical protein